MLWALVAIAGLYAIYVLALFFLQRRLIFPGAPPDWSGSPLPGDMERLWIKTPLAHCEAFFLPPSTGDTPCPAILFAHGNAERIQEWIQPFRDFTALGLGVLLVEYPGYGRSHGTPSQSTITQLMTAAFDILAARDDIDGERIAAVGRSVGGAAVCRIPPDRPAALVLMSTFTSVRAFALPFLFPPFTVLDPYDNIAALQAYSGPVLIIHGKKDGTVPVSHARHLAQATHRSRLVLHDCGHNDCPPDWSDFCRLVQDFLRANRILHRQGSGE
ncbi:MAG: alpha/beta hydrolase [Desulfohalobiaceae bacterium]|nr:alpha/beta hydrolase [Desulfohalobiaceae bacterium]